MRPRGCVRRIIGLNIDGTVRRVSHHEWRERTNDGFYCIFCLYCVDAIEAQHFNPDDA